MSLSKEYDVYYTTGGLHFVGGGSDIWVNDWIELISKRLDVTPVLCIDRIKIGHDSKEWYEAFYKEKFGHLKIVEVNEMIEQLRCIKSQQEIKVIQHAYNIAQKGVQKGIEVAQAGITERELAAEIEYDMRKLGSEGMGIDTIVGSGKINTRSIITRATSRKVKNGEFGLSFNI